MKVSLLRASLTFAFFFHMLHNDKFYVDVDVHVHVNFQVCYYSYAFRLASQRASRAHKETRGQIAKLYLGIFKTC